MKLPPSHITLHERIIGYVLQKIEKILPWFCKWNLMLFYEGGQSTKWFACVLSRPER